MLGVIVLPLTEGIVPVTFTPEAEVNVLPVSTSAAVALPKSDFGKTHLVCAPALYNFGLLKGYLT